MSVRLRSRYLNDDGVVITRRMTRREKRQVATFARAKGIPSRDAVDVLFPAEPLTGDGYPEGSTGARRGPDDVGLTMGSFNNRSRPPRARRDAVGAAKVLSQPQAPPQGDPEPQTVGVSEADRPAGSAGEVAEV
jgi:hypothetical protein